MLTKYKLLVSLSFKLPENFNTILLRYDRENYSITLHPDFQRASQTLRRKAFIHSLILALVILQTLMRVDDPLESKVEAWLAIVLLIIFNTFLQEIRKSPRVVATYMNELIRFGQKYGKDVDDSNCSLEHLRLVDRLSLVFAVCAVISCFALPSGFVFGIHWHNPCKASLLGYWLLPECGGHQIFCGTWNKQLIYIINLWSWYSTVTCAAFGVSILVLLCTMNLRQNLQIFLRIVTSTSLPFYTKYLIYREIQLLSTIANYVLNKMVGVFISGAGVGLGLALTMFVRSFHAADPDLLGSAIFGFVVLDGVLAVMIGFGGIAQLWVDSRECFKKISAVNHGDKWLRRYLKSCPIIKVQFWEDNFVDSLTPLNTLSISINIAVQLLLLTKN